MEILSLRIVNIDLVILLFVEIMSDVYNLFYIKLDCFLSLGIGRKCFLSSRFLYRWGLFWGCVFYICMVIVNIGIRII